MKRRIVLSEDQLRDLKRLAELSEFADEAKTLKKRLTAFRDDNAEALAGNGVEMCGINIRVKTTRELVVETA